MSKYKEELLRIRNDIFEEFKAAVIAATYNGETLDFLPSENDLWYIKLTDLAEEIKEE